MDADTAYSLPDGARMSYCFPFDHVTEVVIPGSAHKLGTTEIFVEVYDTSTPHPRKLPPPALVTIDRILYNVYIYFVVPLSGTVVLTPWNTAAQELPDAHG